jgi:site-specific DNA-cytosine methylase
MQRDCMTAISLFSSAGIGDLAFQKLPVEVLLSCELIEERHQVYLHNFPKTFPVSGDLEETLTAALRPFWETPARVLSLIHHWLQAQALTHCSDNQ